MALKEITGQENERNLVTTINKYTRDGPRLLTLGELGAQEVVGAKRLGGGSPEPKADISILLDNKRQLGISMKKENFSFLESWMDEEKLYLRLKQVGMSISEAMVVVECLKREASNLTKQMSSVIREERSQFVHALEELEPGYEFPNPISKQTMHSLSRFPSFATKAGTFKNNFLIKNHYVKLSVLFGDAYGKFLEIIVGGGEENEHPAHGILVADIPGNVTSVASLQKFLNKIKTVESEVEKYKADPSINIAFRLRPITKTRTTYSRTNRNKYKVGARFYEDEPLGITWTVSTLKT